jgi:hypothetical protein
LVKAARKPAPKKRRKTSEQPNYAEYRDKQASRSRKESAEGREIGDIAPIANLRRRESCRMDLRKFCETYNPKPLRWGWSDAHLKAIARLEEAVWQGALYAFAMPRGSGKSLLCKMATLWAISYAHCRYVFVIGATAKMGQDILEAVKTFARFLPTYAADFPEVSQPVKALKGLAHRANGQLCGGESTMIKWEGERVVLATVPPPPNWPKHWPLREDGMVPTAGSIVGVSGLTGEGIRGSVLTLTDGDQVRPDLVLLDDPSTDASAASPTQNAARELLIAGAVMGLAGPGLKFSAVMPCTVIRPGDLADNFLDRQKHPEWRGERTRMLRSMPTNMEAWDEYFEVYRRCHLKEPPDFSEANAHYRANREALDAGAVAAWEDRKKPGEVSAIQHAMHLYCDRGRVAFFAEYQNDPLPDQDPNRVEALSLDDIAAKVNRVPRYTVPLWATRLTAAVDVQHSLLYYCVCAWSEDFTGAVVDYGTFPDQRRTFFDLADAKATLESVFRQEAQAAGKVYAGSKESNVYQGLERLMGLLLGKEWERQDGQPVRVSRCLIDASDGTLVDTITMFSRQTSYPSVVLPYKGKSATAAYDLYGRHVKKPGERVGLNWIVPNPKGTRLGRHIQGDPNFWKTFVQARLSVPLGGRGSLSLFGSDPATHRMLAAHVSAEKPVRTENKDTGRQVVQWLNTDRMDNHLGDALVYCALAASEQGVSLAETQGRTGGTPRSRPAASPDDAARKRAEFQRNRGF